MVDNFFWQISSQMNTNQIISFTCDEIIKAAKHLKKNKAPGIDGVRTEMLKSGIRNLAPVLTKFFNCIYKIGSFSAAWRFSTLTVIHKKGDKHIPKNYRGIAVGSNLCKLFCLVLNNRLVTFATDNEIIPNEQIGFKRNHAHEITFSF